jgi:hypothetical protein
MSYLVFSQARPAPADEAPLVHKARLFFRAELVFVQRQHRADHRSHYQASLSLPGHPPALLDLERRPATEDDWCAAEEAERAGQATGMAALARRCHVVWELPTSTASERDLLTLCGILAATELGPVMPPDRSTLYGVRGARLRADALSEAYR